MGVAKSFAVVRRNRGKETVFNIKPREFGRFKWVKPYVSRKKTDRDPEINLFLGPGGKVGMKRAL